MLRSLDRRRFLSVTAAAGLGLAAWLAEKRARPVTWTGSAMGAPARITLYHPEVRVAERLIAESVAEIHRVEALFSLFRRDSLLVRLNREGRVTGAPGPFVELVGRARQYSVLSDGAFDVTIQPLWILYARHFARADADPRGPSDLEVAEAKARVGWHGLTVAGDTVAFARPDMGASFNGIAQGWVTDRVADLLRARGIADMLLDLGEMRALGSHPDGRPWRVGIADPRAPDRLFQRLDLRDQAVATSGGYGTRFEPTGRFHHIFDPATGRPASRWAGITVTAPTATAADALTKAVGLAPLAEVPRILAAGGGSAALLIAADGSAHWVKRQESGAGEWPQPACG